MGLYESSLFYVVYFWGTFRIYCSWMNVVLVPLNQLAGRIALFWILVPALTGYVTMIIICLWALVSPFIKRRKFTCVKSAAPHKHPSNVWCWPHYIDEATEVHRIYETCSSLRTASEDSGADLSPGCRPAPEPRTSPPSPTAWGCGIAPEFKLWGLMNTCQKMRAGSLFWHISFLPPFFFLFHSASLQEGNVTTVLKAFPFVLVKENNWGSSGLTFAA